MSLHSSTGLPKAENALAVWSHAPSRLVCEGADRRLPDVTIAIPTWRRVHLLLETLESLLAQQFAGVLEILVTDDYPDSSDIDTVLARFPELSKRNFRYYVNSQNMGLFPNWNRCIELARAPWVSILNDDDLLDPDFLAEMCAELHRHPDADGIVCRKRFFGSQVDRLEQHAAAPRPPRRPAMRLARRSAGLLARPAWRALESLQNFRVWRGKSSRRVAASEFFWGAVLHNGGGFLFRRDVAIRLGGYQLSEGPSADYWFYTRFAHSAHLRQHHRIAASIRKDQTNVTGRTIVDALLHGYRLRYSLTGSIVPRWWRRFLPLTIAHDLADMMREWNADISHREVEEALNVRLTSHRPVRVLLLRVLFWRH